MFPEPQKPTTCCGRGCDINCVWRSYFEAQAAWKELYNLYEKQPDPKELNNK